MHIDRYRKIVGQGAAVQVLSLAFAGWACAVTTTTIFIQPSEPTIAGHTHVAHADKGGLPIGQFDLIAMQEDPFTQDGHFVATGWDAGSKTGFSPSSPLTQQLGFRDQAGTSTAQMEGNVVGAYINSADLPDSPVRQKMMIAPQEIFAKPVVAFPNAASTISSELDLQVPTASGGSYIVADFLFLDPNGVRVSIGIKLFSNGSRELQTGMNYDPTAFSFILNAALNPTGTPYVTPAAGSAAGSGSTWTGWQHFAWSINQNQFASALKQLSTKFHGQVTVTDPTKYVLAEVHLNAEFHFNPGAAELGWSMHRWTVTGTDIGADPAASATMASFPAAAPAVVHSMAAANVSAVSSNGVSSGKITRSTVSSATTTAPAAVSTKVKTVPTAEPVLADLPDDDEV